MTDIRRLKKGDHVKLVSEKAWGAKRGRVMMVRVGRVTKVTKAGYASIDIRPDDRFAPVEGSPVYREWTPRAAGLLPDAHVRIEPISAEEAERLPKTLEAGREYARRLPQET